MIIQEKIKKEAEGYGKLAPAFIEGAKFAFENQWISVKEDLPCNHEELLISFSNCTKQVIVMYEDKKIAFEGMLKAYTKDWACHWEFVGKVIYWMPIPELPKE